MCILPSDEFLTMFAPLLPVDNCPQLIAHQAINFFELWEELEKVIDEQSIPFWGCIWPGAKVLARYILEHPSRFAGKKILDFGCGCGVVSIAASKVQASRVIANDIDPLALHIASKNFLANHVDAVLEPQNLLSIRNIGEDPEIILVAEMFYERSVSDSLRAFLEHFCKNGVEIIIADGGRPFVPESKTRIITDDVITVDFEIEGVKERYVRLLEMIL